MAQQEQQRPTLLSLSEFQVQLSKPVADYLRTTSCYDHDDSEKDAIASPTDTASHHAIVTDSNDESSLQLKQEDVGFTAAPSSSDDDPLQRVLTAMKMPPRASTCRVNRCNSNSSTEEVIQELQTALQEQWTKKQQWSDKRNGQDNTEAAVDFRISQHAILDDVLCIDIVPCQSKQQPSSLAHCRVPPVLTLINKQPDASMFPNWPNGRAETGWPTQHRVVLVDRLCGEAVLRGADIFVGGVLCADSGLVAGEKVAVYAHVGTEAPPPRGLLLPHYHGTCLFLGLGTALCSRADCFRKSRGVAVQMSHLPYERAGPVLPPLHDLIPPDLGFFQNLPSIVVGHVLDPQRGDVTLDMCSAPGGKSLHLASLVQNEATIVSCDRSRQKVLAARDLFRRSGATCITPVALNMTHCCIRRQGDGKADDHSWKSVQEILQSADTTADGLPRIQGFCPNSFDRILLDPPCSALGLRPKLQMPYSTVKELEAFAQYQRRFVHEAVALLKPGGTLTYSTCTIHALENEGMVRFVLDEYRDMELVPIDIPLGRPGLGGTDDVGTLSEMERSYVRRFDPADDESDTHGFFIAKFKKKEENGR